MLNKFITLCTAMLVQCCLLSAVDTHSKGSIKWLTNYEEAVGQAKATSKPLVLFFTGSDWCSWCNKIDEEAFDTREFAEAAGDKFIFVKLDFPQYSTQDSQLKAQNKQLQQKFNIRSFPTVILYDANQGQQIGSTGYRAGGGKQYAAHLTGMLNDYSGYKQKMGVLEATTPSTKNLSGIELKQLHEKAKELHFSNDVIKIVKYGMESDQSLYFLTERYRFLASEGQINNSEAAALKAQLLAADPNNSEQTAYHIALIEFESFSETMNKENFSPEYAIAPLISYMERFGSQDKDNRWRLQMIISQVYLDKNQMPEALKYAQESFESAPYSARPEIALAVQNIKTIFKTPETAISKK